MGSAVLSRVSLLISILSRMNLVLTYGRDSSRVPRRRPFTKPPYAIGSVPSLSGYEIAYRWRSLPRVRRHRASKPQDSSERVLPWQVTLDQLICASLSHIHYWYEVGMLKVPAGSILCMKLRQSSTDWREIRLMKISVISKNWCAVGKISHKSVVFNSLPL